jgi:predicted acylesterase/phospholipase RssA
MSEKNFHIGLCMAGAVSAGAYTAGVMDYLLKSLERWEQNRGQPGIPSHRVQISVIGGASAGGMTGLLTAAAMNQLNQDLFYKSWVIMQEDNMLNQLLDCSDLTRFSQFPSLFNSQFAESIAQSAFYPNLANLNETPAYFHPALKVFTTLTNLEGFPYNISFNTNLHKNNHIMSVHHDYACFQVSSNNQYCKGWIPLDLQKGINATTAKDAALATGAFPIALSARKLTRPIHSILDNPWINHSGLLIDDFHDKYQSLHVDGGLMNNEPFDKVRELLNDLVFSETKEEDRFNDFSQFRSTVLMIDPFPDNNIQAIEQPLNIFGVVKNSLYAMMQQMKAKPMHIANIISKDKAGQFLIAPVRYTMGKDAQRIEGAYAIACGAINGFSGFLSESFRAHDFALGQYNCEMFLKNYFTIPIIQLNKHPIFSQGYNGVNLQSFKSEKTNAVQIIPQFESTKSCFYWPVLQDDTLMSLKPAIRKRVSKLIETMPLKSAKKLLLQLSGHLILNRMVANKTYRYMLKQLKDHGLVK